MGIHGRSRHFPAALAAAVIVAAAAPAATAQDGSAAPGGTKSLEERVAELEKLVKKDDGGLFAYWKNGLRLDSADGDIKLRIGGRIQSDWSWFQHQNDFETASGKPIQAGEEFRRARLQVGGTIYRDFDFMGEYDFAGGTAKFREVWMGTTLGGSSRVQVGSVKEPFGFEEMVSDLFTTFVERSAPDEAFCPSYNTGVLLSGTAAEKRAWWGVGAFRDANDFGDDTGNTRSGELSETARVTGRFGVSKDGRNFSTVGLAATLREPPNDTVQFRARPELHLVPQMVDTGTFSAHQVREWEVDASQTLGPFTAVAEFFQADAMVPGAVDPTFRGWTAQASWFLTGEGRPWNADRAVYDRIVPKANLWKGSGAWELAARCDRLDLDDAGVNGGTQTVWTVGVNWYLNPNMKIQLDHVRAHVANLGSLYGFELRFQVDF